MNTVPADDRGLLLGDGLFETMLFKGARPILWDRHVDRMTRGCAVLGLPAPRADALAEAADRALAQAGLAQTRAAVRLTWTAGSGGRGLDRPDPATPRLIAAAAPALPPDEPARLTVSSIRRNEASPTSRLKSLAYLDNVLARRQARSGGADEALMLNNQGQVAGCAAANLFWIRDGALFTPALDCGTLDGVMRAQVLAAAPALGLQVLELRTDISAVLDAEAVFITNSLIGVRGICALDGKTYGEQETALRFAAACSDFI